jgi:HicB family
MVRITLRIDEELLAEVRRHAKQDGVSVNKWILRLARIAMDPDSAGPDEQHVRERLDRAAVVPLRRPR